MFSAEKIIREILFGVRVAKVFGGVWHVEQTPYPNEKNESDPFSRPAFVLRIGEEGIKFERRDVLDDIAYAVFSAAAHGFLRRCKGDSQGWSCPTPFLVADEKRRVYCYMRCGDEAKSRAKTRWWRENLGSKKRDIRRSKRSRRTGQ